VSADLFTVTLPVFSIVPQSVDQNKKKSRETVGSLASEGGLEFRLQGDRMSLRKN
jgi:hypothetical protein